MGSKRKRPARSTPSGHAGSGPSSETAGGAASSSSAGQLLGEPESSSAVAEPAARVADASGGVAGRTRAVAKSAVVEAAYREQVTRGKLADKEARQKEKKAKARAADVEWLPPAQQKQQQAEQRIAQREQRAHDQAEQRAQQSDRQLEKGLLELPPSVTNGQTATAARFATVVAAAASEAVQQHASAATALAPLLLRTEQAPSGVTLELLETWRAGLHEAFSLARKQRDAEAQNQVFQSVAMQKSCSLYDRFVRLHEPRLSGDELDRAWGLLFLKVKLSFIKLNRPPEPHVELPPPKELSGAEKGVVEYCACVCVQRQLVQAQRMKSRHGDKELLRVSAAHPAHPIPRTHPLRATCPPRLSRTCTTDARRLQMLATRDRDKEGGVAAAYLEWRELWGGLLRPTAAFAAFMHTVESRLARFLNIATFVQLRADAAARAHRALQDDAELDAAWRPLMGRAWVGQRDAKAAAALRERISSLRARLLRCYVNLRVKVVTKRLLGLVAQGQGQGQAIRTQLKAAAALLKQKSGKQEGKANGKENAGE